MTEMGNFSDERLRLARLAQGQSQEELARLANVSRQAISGFESGRWSPSLGVALSLARALHTSVEELFGAPAESAPLSAKLVAPECGDAGPPGSRRRVLLAEIAGDAQAFPLTGDNCLTPGFRPASGIFREQSETVGVAHRIAEPVPTLAVAGCDPALTLLSAPLARRKPRLELLWWPCGNAKALRLLAAGAVHVAAVHRAVDAAVRPTRGVEVVGFASWREGLAVAPGHRETVSGLADVVAAGLRIVNREPGSEARRLLDEQLALLGAAPERVVGYETACRAHLLVASAVASGLAEAGVTTEPAAIAFRLAFVPWQQEVTELHVARANMGSPEVRALFDVLGGSELPRQLDSIDGYDASPCGRVVVAGN